MSALENGTTMPSLGTLWLLAERLELTVGELLDGVNSGDPVSSAAVKSYTADHEPPDDRDSTGREE